jgi:hypothetical protein
MVVVTLFIRTTLANEQVYFSFFRQKEPFELHRNEERDFIGREMMSMVDAMIEREQCGEKN